MRSVNTTDVSVINKDVDVAMQGNICLYYFYYMDHGTFDGIVISIYELPCS